MAPTRSLTRLNEIPERENKTRSVVEKDATELELEKALFGDEAGFLGSIRAQQSSQDDFQLKKRRSSDYSILSSEDGVEGLADEELFFLDSNTNDLPRSITEQLTNNESQERHQYRTPAWYDSDDERIMVSLATNTRLRKLRETEDDDIVTGHEYIKRLRSQYERLHPSPQWVQYARKRRKLTDDEKDRQDPGSDSDISMADENVASAVQPLAELLRSTLPLTNRDIKHDGNTKNRTLRPEVIDIERTKDVTSSGPSSVDALEFHHFYPLLLAAGPSSTVSLYHISPLPPNPNPLLTSLHVKGTPLHTARFCNVPSSKSSIAEYDETRIFLSSRRRYFHTWELATGTVSKVSRTLFGDMRKEQKTMESFKISPCGRYMGLVGSTRKGGGSINVLSTGSMQWICTCRVTSQGGIADFAWWSDGNGFSAVGKNGEVSEYDIESMQVIKRWKDEGAVGTTVISLGGSNGPKQFGQSRWVAIGSSSGIVNLYDRQKWTYSKSSTNASGKPEPERILDQLTTPISHIHFSSDGQLLLIASRWKKNALKLVHLPSCTIYRNWPTEKTSLGRISALAISPNGQYLAVGNEQGKIKLWEMRG